MNGVAEKLEMCRTLEKGWDSYDADPPTGQCVDAAKEFIERLSLRGFEPTFVCPDANGGVGFGYRCRGRKADLEIDNEGDICWTWEDEDGEFSVACGEWELSNQDIEEAVVDFLEKAKMNGSAPIPMWNEVYAQAVSDFPDDEDRPKVATVIGQFANTDRGREILNHLYACGGGSRKHWEKQFKKESKKFAMRQMRVGMFNISMVWIIIQIIGWFLGRYFQE